MEYKEIGNLDVVISLLDSLSDIQEDKFMKSLALSINAHFVSNVSKGLDAYRNPFQPLSEKTKNRAGRGGDSAIPLNDKGFLLGGLQTEIDGDTIRFYNDMEYALYHQNGDDLPERLIYPEYITDYMEEEINKAIDYQVDKLLSRRK